MNPGIWQIVNIVVGGVVLAALLGIWKLLNGKADKLYVDGEFRELRADNKVQSIESLRQYRELQTSIEGVKEKIAALDKHSLTITDLTEMKADIKELVKGQAEALKLIDNMPDRVTSLEATRNKQSEG